MMHVSYDFTTDSWKANMGLKDFDMAELPSRYIQKCKNNMNSKTKRLGPAGKALVNEWRATYDPERREWGPRSEISRVLDLGDDMVVVQTFARIRLSPRRVQYAYREWRVSRFPYTSADILEKRPIVDWVVRE